MGQKVAGQLSSQRDLSVHHGAQLQENGDGLLDGVDQAAHRVPEEEDVGQEHGQDDNVLGSMGTLGNI